MESIKSASDVYPNGTVIAGRYEITSFLAQGGMAQVYVANQCQMERDVALKVLSPMYTSNPNVVMRFLREARVVGRLTHPNTIRVYDMGETADKRLFFAMELLQGQTLNERIKSGCLPVTEALDIVRQVAGSLDEAHKMGVIHRDLKPDNIFLTHHKMVKVLDFGIVKLRDDSQDTVDGRRLTKAGTAPGTPEYMSPEQARGLPLDARSDLYSLGIVLYEILCGHPPFEGTSYLETILMQVQNEVPELPDSIPQPVRRCILNRLLSKNPDQRPDNAEMFIGELDALQKQIGGTPGNNPIPNDALAKAQAEIDSLRHELEQARQELRRLRHLDMPDTTGESSSTRQRNVRKGQAVTGVIERRTDLISQPDNIPQRLDPVQAHSRPIETLTGRQSRPVSGVINGGNAQTTFMMFAQPLCSKLGPQKAEDALYLAQGIWNAAVLGGQAMNEIFDSVSGSPSLVKIVEAMLARKSKYFADERWQIDNLGVNTDNQGRLSITLECHPVV